METIVVKCGGNAAVDPEAVCADVAGWHRLGHRIVLVHGGSAAIDGLANRLGVAGRRLVAPDGLSTRYTDAATLEVVLLALAGAVKPRLVGALGRQGVPAVGLTGLDGGVIRASRVTTVRAVIDGRRAIVRDLHAGRIASINTRLLDVLLDQGYLPVISPPAVDETGQPVNVDADRVAAAVAGALGASDLVLLTGAPGLLRDPDDESTVVRTCQLDSERVAVGGGMGLKLVAAREAVRAGVGRVVIGDGRRDRPLSTAMDGHGTVVTAAAGALR